MQSKLQGGVASPELVERAERRLPSENWRDLEIPPYNRIVAPTQNERMAQLNGYGLDRTNDTGPEVPFHPDP
jgi:hypothetical protein